MFWNIVQNAPELGLPTYEVYLTPILTGTHDLQNISVSSPLPGTVRVSGNFLQGSAATGVLVIVYSLCNDSNVHYNSYHGSNDQSIEVASNSYWQTDWWPVWSVCICFRWWSAFFKSCIFTTANAFPHQGMLWPVTVGNCGL